MAGHSIQALFPDFYGKLLIDSVISFIILFTILVSRTVYVLSDRENLFNFGVPRRRLFRSIFIFELILLAPVQIFFLGVIQVLAASYPVPGAYIPASIFIIMPTTILLSILFASRGYAPSMALFGITSAIDFSNLLGNPFSMGSIASSDYMYAMVTCIAFLVLSFAYAYRSVILKGFQFASSITTDKKAVIKHPMDMSQKKGRDAIFRFWFHISPLLTNNRKNTRINKAGRVTFLRLLILVSSLSVLMSAVLAYAWITYVQGHTQQFLLSFLMGYFGGLTLILVYAFVLGASFNSIAHERLWISLGAIKNNQSLRLHTLARSASASLSLLPLLIVPLALYFLGLNSYALQFFYTFSFAAFSTFPAMFLSQVISAFLSTEQIMDDTIPQQGVLMKLAALGPLFAVLIAMLFGIFTPIVLLFVSVGLIALALPLLFSDGVFDKAALSLIKRGFI